MTYPLIIPNVGYDHGLNAYLAVSITGMGVNFGRHVSMDQGRDTFFDDEVVTDLHQQYLDHDISIGTLTQKIREYFDDRGGAWGFKFSVGISLLPLYKLMYPEMSVLVGRLQGDSRLHNLIAQLMREDSILAATLPETWEDVEAKMHTLNEFTQGVPCMVIPDELFINQRQKALAQMAAFIGGDYRSGNVAKMVDSALRKLMHVYDEREIGSGCTR